MLQVSTEDVTVPWGRAPDPLDVQTGRYRMAVFQDVVESIDKKLLYFLYDPVADEQSGTSFVLHLFCKVVVLTKFQTFVGLAGGYWTCCKPAKRYTMELVFGLLSHQHFADI